MAEGVAVGTMVVSGPALDDRHNRPDPDPVNAPHGWAWDRPEGRWRPAMKRGNYARKSRPIADPPRPAAALPPDDSGQDGPEPGRDPDPGWFGDSRGGGSDQPGSGRKLTIDDVPKQVVNDIAGFAGLIGAPVLALLQQADPYCGSALAASYEPIVDAVLPLLCRSEKVVRYFTGDKSDWMLWCKLAMVLAPVGKAVLDHHILRKVDVVRDENGIPHIVPHRREGESEHGDHLQPPMPADYSQYAA